MESSINYLALNTDGQMSVKEMMKECPNGRWIPLLVYRENPEDNPIVPLFFEEKTIKSFIKRNLPKNWTHGALTTTSEVIQSIRNKGWIIREMNFPHKIDLQKIGFEIFNLDEKPDFELGYLNG